MGPLSSGTGAGYGLKRSFANISAARIASASTARPFEPPVTVRQWRPDPEPSLDARPSQVIAGRVDVSFAWACFPLKGDLAGRWGVAVSRTWRIVFRIEGGEVFDVDLVHYH